MSHEYKSFSALGKSERALAQRERFLTIEATLVRDKNVFDVSGLHSSSVGITDIYKCEKSRVVIKRIQMFIPTTSAATAPVRVYLSSSTGTPLVLNAERNRGTVQDSAIIADSQNFRYRNSLTLTTLPFDANPLITSLSLDVPINDIAFVDDVGRSLCLEVECVDTTNPQNVVSFSDVFGTTGYIHLTLAFLPI